LPAREPWTTGGSTVLKTPSAGAKQHTEDDKGSRRVVRDFGGWELLGHAGAPHVLLVAGCGWVHGGGVGNTL